MKRILDLTIKVFIFIFGVFSYFTSIAQEINHWEMIVDAKDSWHYFPANAEPQSNWAKKDFNTAQWASGSGGIGYGDNDDATIVVRVPTVYIRTNFNITNLSVIASAILHVDYDDGFVAYLNGYEIARANVGTTGVKPTYNTYALTPHEAQIPLGGIPESFIIHRDTLLKYLTEGENVLALQVHNVSSTSSDLSSTTFFTVGVTSEQTSYRQVPDWLSSPLQEGSSLPILHIETNGRIIVDEPKIQARLKVIDHGNEKLNSIFDEPTGYNGLIGIEIRGESSQQMFPKKSYSFEVQNELGEGLDTSLLDMPAHEDWVLYAPYSDKTMLRNALTFHLGSKMGGWQPRFKFCEVYINGNYQGVYLLIERIKRDKDRVDIAKLRADEISGDDLTGGYIVKVDKLTGLNATEYFTTRPTNGYGDASNYTFSYVYPRAERMAPQQKDYIFNFLEDFENTLNGISFKNPETGYKKYIDVYSFIDFQIINEFTNNADGYRISTYFHKDKDSKGGKLFAGPLWDYNLGYGNVNFLPLNVLPTTWLYPRYGPNNYNTMHWWVRLMEDADYSDRFYYRWNELRSGPFHEDSIMAFIDDLKENLGEAVDRNYERWPIIGQYVWPNYHIGATYEEDIDFFKNWIRMRLAWMDANIMLSTGVFLASSEKPQVIAYPNPVVNYLNVKFNLESRDVMFIEIVNVNGQVVFNKVYYPSDIGAQVESFNIQHIKPGIYMLRIKQNDKVSGLQKLLIGQ